MRSSGGATSSSPSITTSGGVGSALFNRQRPQTIDITQNALTGWTASSPAFCTDQRRALAEAAALHPGRRPTRWCAGSPTGPLRWSPPPCVTNPVANPDFTPDLGSSTADRRLGPATTAWRDDHQRLTTSPPQQPAESDGEGRGAGQRDPGRHRFPRLHQRDRHRGDAEVAYAGIVYAAVSRRRRRGLRRHGHGDRLQGRHREHRLDPHGQPAHADGHPARHRHPTQRRARVLDREDRRDGTDWTDNWFLDNVSVRTTAVCLRKQSTGGVGTFEFASTNIDTNTTTAGLEPTFSVTTVTRRDARHVRPAFGVPGKELVVPPRAATSRSPKPDRPDGCRSPCRAPTRATGAAVPAVAIIWRRRSPSPGAAMPARTVLNCLVTDSQQILTLRKSAERGGQRAARHHRDLHDHGDELGRRDFTGVRGPLYRSVGRRARRRDVQYGRARRSGHGDLPSKRHGR